jgi:hypothetical protein
VQAQTCEYLTQVQKGVTGASKYRSSYVGTDIGMPRTNTGESKLVQVQVQVHRNLLTLFKFTLCPSATLICVMYYQSAYRDRKNKGEM